MTKLCGIYLLTNTANGLRYIGQSIDIKKRWYLHSRGLCKMRLGRSIACYGWNSFTAEILELCPLEELNKREEHWIYELGTISPAGYNLTSGGGQPTFFSAETRAAMSKGRTGIKVSEEAKAKMSASAKNRSPEHRKKLSDANKARAYTPELIAKLSSGNKGRIFSDEHREKLSSAGKRTNSVSRLKPCNAGRIHSDEAKAKMSASHLGKRLTAAHISNIAASRKGKKQSPETIAKRLATFYKNKLATAQ